MNTRCFTGWPPLDEEGNIIWNQPMSPLNIPEDGLELPEDEDVKETLFAGKYPIARCIISKVAFICIERQKVQIFLQAVMQNLGDLYPGEKQNVQKLWRIRPSDIT